MKLITVVGIRKSGKTSTVTALLAEIRRRELTVGSCKSVFCPTFSIDKPGSNTAKHMQAGSAPVCSRAKHETAFIYPAQLPLSRILRLYGDCDYVLLEGDYLAPVPRLVAAHSKADALPRTNDLTLAYVGRISTKKEEALSLPCFDPLTQAAQLLDFIDAHVPETTVTPALDIPLPPVPGVTDDGFCQCGCHHHEKQMSAVQVTVGGRTIRLSPEQEAQVLSWAEEQG